MEPSASSAPPAAPPAAPTPQPPPQPSAAMQVDTAPDDLARAVHFARQELGAVITALMRVFLAVEANGGPPLERLASVQGLSEAQKKERAEALLKRSENVTPSKLAALGVAMPSFDGLRKAVSAAAELSAKKMEEAKQMESQVSEEDKQALIEKRAQLVEQVAAKNKKVKILIDHLRELHRDIVALLAPYKKQHASQPRKA